MLESTLRTVAVACSAIVLVSWGLFAVDETRSASGESVAGIEGTHTGPATMALPTAVHRHTGLRKTIDDTSDALTSPFAGLVDSSPSSWIRRTVPALLALLLYGFGLGYLARFASGRAHGVAPPRRA